MEIESKQTICLAVKWKDSDNIQGNDVDPAAFPDLSWLMLKFYNQTEFRMCWSSDLTLGFSPTSH